MIDAVDFNLFKSFDDFIRFFDAHSYQLYADHKLADACVKYKRQATLPNEQCVAQIEIHCRAYEIYGSNSFAHAYSLDPTTNQVTQHPDIARENREAIDYIRLRAKESTSPLLQARYNHLLWSVLPSREKKSYGISAANHYSQAIQEYHTYICKLKGSINEDRGMYQVARLHENLIAICDHFKLNELAEKVSKFLLFEAPGISFSLKCNILSAMVNRPKLFKPGSFAMTLSIFEAELRKKKKPSDDFLMVNTFLNTAIKIAAKTNSDVRKWYRAKGHAYLRLSKAISDPQRFWIAIDQCSFAIEAYRMAGDHRGKKQAEKLYAELKPKVKLSAVKVRFSIEARGAYKEYDDHVKSVADRWLTQSPEQIYFYLGTGAYLPQLGTVKKKGQASFTEFATLIAFDKNKNVARPKDEKKRNEWESYAEDIRFTMLPFLRHLLIPGIKTGHLTAQYFLKYLTEHTWIGQPYISVDLGGKKVQLNWLEHLAPALIEFFNQVRAWESSDYYTPNFILCIDSMTLKMEGLLRNFFQRNKMPTSTNRQGKGMQEIYIHQLIEEASMRKYFKAADIKFFKYLFSNEGGTNLRNNIAHCFYHPLEYHPDKMLLLIAALMRLSLPHSDPSNKNNI